MSIKVLLHVDVDHLGYIGDVVEVSNGYARNYLLPQQLAVAPNEANVKAIAEEKAKQIELRRLAREELLRAAEKVNSAEVTILVRANEQGHLFGSVSQADIASALQEKGFTIQTKHIMLGHHLRELGTFDVKLRFANDIEAGVQVCVARSEDDTGGSESESESESSASGQSASAGNTAVE